MRVLPALIVSLTLAMTVVMIPKIYWAWSTARRCYLKGEVEKLRELLREQNGWTKRHFCCGLTGLALVWLMAQYLPANIPSSLTDGVAFFVTISLAFAIAESLVAQHIAQRAAAIPVRLRRDE